MSENFEKTIDSTEPDVEEFREKLSDEGKEVVTFLEGVAKKANGEMAEEIKRITDTVILNYERDKKYVQGYLNAKSAELQDYRKGLDDQSRAELIGVLDKLVKKSF